VSTLKTSVPDATIYLQTVLPTSGAHAGLNVLVNKLNPEISRIAKASKCQLIDLNAGFRNEKGEMDAQFTNDGVHLTPKGYEHWKNVLERVSTK